MNGWMDGWIRLSCRLNVLSECEFFCYNFGSEAVTFV